MFDFRRKDTLRANISTSYKVVFAKRRELQMADLVSGNLKEEKNAHSTQRLHPSGPLHQPRNLLFRYVTCRSENRRVWVLSCTFGGKRAQTATFNQVAPAHAPLSR